MGQNDIHNKEHIQLIVDSFYTKVKEDELLSDIFNNVIQDRWPKHLETMYSFWETILLGEHTYQGSPFIPHANLDITTEHFNRWIYLFNATIDEHFSGEKATEAKWRATRMAEMFMYKIEYYRNNYNKPIM